jgi:hypothetical protein
VIAVSPVGEKLTKVLERIKTMGEGGGALAQVIESKTPADTAVLGQKIEKSLMFFYAEKEADLVSALNVIKNLKRRIDTNQLRVALHLNMKSVPEYVLKKLRSVGISEIITEPVTERGLILKVERLIKANPRFKELLREASASGKKGSAAGAAGQKGAYGSGQGGAGSGGASAEVKKAPPLKTKSDFWIFQGAGARRVGSRWVVRFFGPGPGVGKWVEVQTGSGGSATWKWEFQGDEGNQFLLDPGQWFYTGQRAPQFQEFQWWFSGSDVSLEFRKEGVEKAEAKFKTDGASGPLTIAADGPQNMAFRTLIEETYSKKLKSKKEQEREQEEEASGGTKKRKGPSDEEFNGENAYGVHSAEDTRPFRLVAPLKLKSDFWTFEEDGRIMRVGVRWSIRMIGPGRRAGRWVSLPSSDPEVKFWKWEASDFDQQIFMKEDGHWVFRGEEPIFESLRWVFVGESPELAFHEDGKATAVRFRLADDKKIEMARDSEASKRARPQIEETLEFEATIKATEEAQELEAKLDAERTGKELEAEEEAQSSRELEAQLEKEEEGSELELELGAAGKKKRKRRGEESAAGEAEDEQEKPDATDEELDLTPKKKKRRGADADADAEGEEAEKKTPPEEEPEEAQARKKDARAEDVEQGASAADSSAAQAEAQGQ